jgi:hypothetical protein
VAHFQGATSGRQLFKVTMPQMGTWHGCWLGSALTLIHTGSQAQKHVALALAYTSQLCGQMSCSSNVGSACSPSHQEGAAAAPALQVCGRTQSDVYLVLPPHYCSCQSFFYDVVSKSEAVTVGGALGDAVLCPAGAACAAL